MPRQVRGFTLLELNVVVVIIGVLAAIAAPAYTTHLRRAQSAEALNNTQTIAYLEEVHILETHRALSCPATPPEVPRATRVPFGGGGPWDDLGVHMEARVRFQYSVETPSAREYRVIARGDLDGDGVQSEYVVDSRTLSPEVSRAGE